MKNKNYKWIIVGLAVLLIAALIFVIVSCSKAKNNKGGFDISQEAGKVHSIKNEKDDQGRVIKHTVTSPKGEVVGYEEYTYDEQGRKATATSRDAKGNFKNKYAYIYDETNYGDNIVRVKEQITLDASNTKIASQVKEYNELGKETKVYNYEKDTLKDYVVYEYDANGQMTKQSSYKGNGQLKNYMTYTYDANGNETVKKFDANGNEIK